MNEFDACATDQHEYKKLVEVGKLDTVVLPELNDVVECNVYLIWANKVDSRVEASFPS